MTVVYSIDTESTSISKRLDSLLEPLGGFEAFVKPGEKVLIKPNLVAPFHHAVTDLKLLSLIVERVHECGGIPLIGESSGFEFNSETTFSILGIYDLAKKLQARFINFDEEAFVEIELKGAGGRKVKIPRVVLESDKIINIPKLKRHSLTKATIGIKNLFGLLHYDSRRQLHAFGLDSGIFALGRTIIPNLVIVDGSVVTARAVYGKQTKLNFLAASQNIIATDVFCCQHLQLNWQDVEHIKLSVEKDPRCLTFETIDVSEKLKNLDNRRKPYSAPLGLKWEDTLSKKIHRFGYKVIYFCDIFYNRLSKQNSIIPVLHYYFGIRPVLHPKWCNQCGKCLPICPVDAIDLKKQKISAKRCMPVRCLECIDACPENAIGVRGRNVDSSYKKRA